MQIPNTWYSESIWSLVLQNLVQMYHKCSRWHWHFQRCQFIGYVSHVVTCLLSVSQSWRRELSCPVTLPIWKWGSNVSSHSKKTFQGKWSHSPEQLTQEHTIKKQSFPHLRQGLSIYCTPPGTSHISQPRDEWLRTSGNPFTSQQGSGKMWAGKPAQGNRQYSIRNILNLTHTGDIWIFWWWPTFKWRTSQHSPL